MNELILPRPSESKLLNINFWWPTKNGAELFWTSLEKWQRSLLNKYFKLSTREERVLFMSGSDANYLSKKIGDLVFGATAYTAPATIYAGLWTATIDDTFNGGTANVTDYGSYAPLALTNNTTIFGSGTGTTTYVKSWPSDGAHNFPSATSPSTNPVVYIGFLDGNAGTSADNGLAWGSVTSTPIGNGDTPQIAQNAITQTRD